MVESNEEKYGVEGGLIEGIHLRMISDLEKFTYIFV
jgi:hypothetical protein